MTDYEKIFRILRNIQFLAIESGNASLQYNVGELNKLLDKFVLWKKENIEFQSSFESGPEVFQYTLKAWFTAEHNITIDSKIIDSNFKETILPDLKDNLIKYIDYNLRCSEKERN